MSTTYNNSMASRSTLELMLEKILQENEEEGSGSPPPLPARPVSRARLPSPARRGIQQSVKLIKNKANSDFTRGVILNSAQELIQTNGLDDMSAKKANIRGVLILQRCYRGYRARCYVNKIKISVITLQSFIRAVLSRKAYHHLVERLSPNTEMQRQNVQDVQSNLYQLQNGAIIRLQSRIRGWLTRRHYKNIERNQDVPAEKTQAEMTSKSDSKDHIQIPRSIVFELQRQVLKTEAALRERKEQNAALRNNVKQYEERWLEYEDKMKSLEKMWQEQLASMQVNLADAAKKKVAGKITMTKSPVLLQAESPFNMVDNSDPLSNHQNCELDDNDDGNYFQVKFGWRVSKKDVIEEFQKLESQFGSWEKEYSMRLEETKATMKKISLPQKEKNQKRWWRRPLRK